MKTTVDPRMQATSVKRLRVCSLRAAPVSQTAAGRRLPPRRSGSGWRRRSGAEAGVGSTFTQAEERLRLAAALDAVRHQLGERRTVLEAVAGASPEQPPVGPLGVACEQEVGVGAQ